MNKIYEMIIEDALTDGIFAISLVDSPAIMEDYILLSKDNKIRIEIKLDKLVDEKRHVVSGPILVPDLVIPRKGYDIVFRKETIRKLSEKFMIENLKDNVTLQHQVSVNKVNMVESWIVEDTKNDKSSYYGYELPAGTWFGTYKVNDEELWQEYIASGVLKGFSVEGNFSQQEVELNNCKLEGHIEELSDEDKEIFEIYLALTYPEKELNTYYKWEMGTGDKQCPSCKEYNGQIFTLREWTRKAIPAVKNGTIIAGMQCVFKYDPFGTYCESACQCKLVKVNSPDFIKKHIVKPW